MPTYPNDVKSGDASADQTTFEQLIDDNLYDNTMRELGPEPVRRFLKALMRRKADSTALPSLKAFADADQDVKIDDDDLADSAKVSDVAKENNPSGVWPIERGGTNADDEAKARTNLDVYSKSEADAKVIQLAQLKLGYTAVAAPLSGAGSNRWGRIQLNNISYYNKAIGISGSAPIIQIELPNFSRIPTGTTILFFQLDLPDEIAFNATSGLPETKTSTSIVGTEFRIVAHNHKVNGFQYAGAPLTPAPGYEFNFYGGPLYLLCTYLSDSEGWLVYNASDYVEEHFRRGYGVPPIDNILDDNTVTKAKLAFTPITESNVDDRIDAKLPDAPSQDGRILKSSGNAWIVGDDINLFKGDWSNSIEIESDHYYIDEGQLYKAKNDLTVAQNTTAPHDDTSNTNWELAIESSSGFPTESVSENANFTFGANHVGKLIYNTATSGTITTTLDGTQGTDGQIAVFYGSGASTLEIDNSLTTLPTVTVKQYETAVFMKTSVVNTGFWIPVAHTGSEDIGLIQGDWQSGTAVKAGEYYFDGGNLFEALSDLTAADNDLRPSFSVNWRQALASIGANAMIRGQWQRNTLYLKGDGVEVDGVAYYALVNHTSSDTSSGFRTDASKWKRWGAFDSDALYQGVWEMGRAYTAGQEVNYNQIRYRANRDLTGYPGSPGEDTSSWSLVFQFAGTRTAARWRGAWTARTEYKQGDLVSYQYPDQPVHGDNAGRNVIFHCSSSHSGRTENPSRDPTRWGNNRGIGDYKGEWSSTTTYRYDHALLKDYVSSGGNLYYTTIDNNLNRAVTDTSVWNATGYGSNDFVFWRAGTAYNSGTYVAASHPTTFRWGIYRATSAISIPNIQPPNAVGNNNWYAITAGGRFDEWEAGTRYNVDDDVVQGGYVWQCTTAHTSSSAFATDQSNWERLIFLGKLKGPWAAGTWDVGDYTEHDSKFYRCIVARTSSDTSNPATDTTGWTGPIGGSGGSSGSPEWQDVFTYEVNSTPTSSNVYVDMGHNPTIDAGSPYRTVMTGKNSNGTFNAAQVISVVWKGSDFDLLPEKTVGATRDLSSDFIIEAPNESAQALSRIANGNWLIAAQGSISINGFQFKLQKLVGAGGSSAAAFPSEVQAYNNSAINRVMADIDIGKYLAIVPTADIRYTFDSTKGSNGQAVWIANNSGIAGNDIQVYGGANDAHLLRTLKQNDTFPFIKINDVWVDMFDLDSTTTELEADITANSTRIEALENRNPDIPEAEAQFHSGLTAITDTTNTIHRYGGFVKSVQVNVSNLTTGAGTISTYSDSTGLTYNSTSHYNLMGLGDTQADWEFAIIGGKIGTAPSAQHGIIEYTHRGQTPSAGHISKLICTNANNKLAIAKPGSGVGQLTGADIQLVTEEDNTSGFDVAVGDQVAVEAVPLSGDGIRFQVWFYDLSANRWWRCNDNDFATGKSLFSVNSLHISSENTLMLSALKFAKHNGYENHSGAFTSTVRGHEDEEVAWGTKRNIATVNTELDQSRNMNFTGELKHNDKEVLDTDSGLKRPAFSVKTAHYVLTPEDDNQTIGVQTGSTGTNMRYVIAPESLPLNFTCTIVKDRDDEGLVRVAARNMIGNVNNWNSFIKANNLNGVQYSTYTNFDFCDLWWANDAIKITKVNTANWYQVDVKRWIGFEPPLNPTSGSSVIGLTRSTINIPFSGSTSYVKFKQAWVTN